MADNINQYFDRNAKIKNRKPVNPNRSTSSSTMYPEDMVKRVKSTVEQLRGSANHELLSFLNSELFGSDDILKSLPRSALKDVNNILDDMGKNLPRAQENMTAFVETCNFYKGVFDNMASIASARNNVQSNASQIHSLENEDDLNIVKAFEFMGVPLEQGDDGKWRYDPAKTNDYGVKINGAGVMSLESVNAFLDNYLNVDPAIRRDRITPNQLFRYYLSQIQDNLPNVTEYDMNNYRRIYNENNPDFNGMKLTARADRLQAQQSLQGDMTAGIASINTDWDMSSVEESPFLSKSAVKSLASLTRVSDKMMDAVDKEFSGYEDVAEVKKQLSQEIDRLEHRFADTVAAQTVDGMDGNQVIEGRLNTIGDRLKDAKEALRNINQMDAEQREEPTEHTDEQPARESTPETVTPQQPAVSEQQPGQNNRIINILPEMSQLHEGTFRADLSLQTADFFVQDGEYWGIQYGQYSDEYKKEHPDAKPEEIIDAFMTSLGEKPSENEPSVLDQLREKDGIMLGSPEALKSALYAKFAGVADQHRTAMENEFSDEMVLVDRTMRYIANDDGLYQAYQNGDDDKRKEIVNKAMADLGKNGQLPSQNPPNDDERALANKRWANLARSSGAKANLEHMQEQMKEQGIEANPLLEPYKRFTEQMLGRANKDLDDLFGKEPIKEEPKGNDGKPGDGQPPKKDEWTTYGKLHPSEGSVSKLQKKLKPYNTKACVKWLEKILESIDKVKVKKKNPYINTSAPAKEPNDHPENEGGDDTNTNDPPTTPSTTPPVNDSVTPPANDPATPPSNDPPSGGTPNPPQTDTPAVDEENDMEGESRRARDVFAVASLPAFSIMRAYRERLEAIAKARNIEPIEKCVEIQQAKDVEFLLQYVSSLNPNNNPEMYGGKDTGFGGDFRYVVQRYVEDIICGKNSDLDIESWAETCDMTDKRLVAKLKNGLLLLSGNTSRAENSTGEKAEPSGLAVALYGFSSDITQTESGEWQIKIGSKIDHETFKEMIEAKDDSERWNVLVEKYIEKTFKSPVQDMQFLNTVMEDASKNGLSIYPHLSQTGQLFTDVTNSLMQIMQAQKNQSNDNLTEQPEMGE